MMGWFDKKDVPPEMVLLHSEIKELKARDEVMRREINKLNARMSKVENRPAPPPIGPFEGLGKKSLWEQIFGHKANE